MKSDYLRIRVSERFRTRAEVAYNAEMAGNLLEVMPRQMIDTVEGFDVDLGVVAFKAAAGDFPPGELFSVEDGEVNLRAWLE